MFEFFLHYLDVYIVASGGLTLIFLAFFNHVLFLNVWILEFADIKWVKWKWSYPYWNAPLMRLASL